LSSHSGWNLLASVLHDFDSARSTSAFLNFSIPLGTRGYASSSVTHTSNGTSLDVQAGQSAAVTGQIGWRLQDSTGSFARQTGEVEYRSDIARVYGGVDRLSGATAVRVGATGAIVALGETLRATNTVNDSFAIVDVDGRPGVRIYQENRLVGRSGADGTLLLPQIQSNQENRIAIEPLDLDINSSSALSTFTQKIVPSEHSGVIAKFALVSGGQALVVFVDREGKPLPVGSVVVQSDGHVNPVGHDGEAFLTRLQKENTVTLVYGKTRCEARFPFLPVPNDLPRIGPFRCSTTS
jgi:outer membrane usher protein